MYCWQEEIRLLRQRLKEMEQSIKLTDDSRENVRLQQQIVQLQQQLEQVTSNFKLWFKVLGDQQNDSLHRPTVRSVYFIYRHHHHLFAQSTTVTMSNIAKRHWGL